MTGRVLYLLRRLTSPIRSSLSGSVIYYNNSRKDITEFLRQSIE